MVFSNSVGRDTYAATIGNHRGCSISNLHLQFRGTLTMIETKFPIVYITGSMRYFEMMLRVAQRMEYEGHIVFMSHVNRSFLDRDVAPGTFDMLCVMHKEMIRLCHTVFIVNCTLDDRGNALGPTYIGEGTRMEIAIAGLLNKRVEYMNRHIDSGLGGLFL